MEVSSLESPNNSLSNSRKHRWIMLGGMCLVVGIIILVWFIGHQKSLGEITLPLASINSPQIVVPQPPAVYQGKYFTFSYPSDFKAHPEEQPVKFPFLEQVLLIKNDIQGKKIAVVIQERGQNLLEESSAYRFRDRNKEAYLKEKLEKNGINFTVFTHDVAPFEVGAFWWFENKLASIVVSSPTTNSGLRETLFSVLDSLSINTKK